MITAADRRHTSTSDSRAYAAISSHARRGRLVRHSYPWLALLALAALLVALAPSAVARASAPDIQSWTPTGTMLTAQLGPSVRLPNGQVLVAGGCGASAHLAASELYDPATGTWRATGSMVIGRCAHTLTLLPNGQVLAAGGSDSNGYLLASAELYNPATGTWRLTGGMNYARSVATATLLPDGDVLEAGGYIDGASTMATAELYNPATGIWTPTGSMTIGREWFTATLLANGKVLAVGGLSVCVPFNCNPIASAEVYDPATGVWTPTGSLPIGLAYQTATLLPNGDVLVAGGSNVSCNNGCPPTASAELYLPGTGTWVPTGSMTTPREFHTETLLADGTVLVAGGVDNAYDTLSTAESYQPSTGAWTPAGTMTSARAYQNATVLANGQVLVSGGCTIVANSCATFLTSAELYVPQVVLAAITVTPNSGPAGSTTTVAGVGFGAHEIVTLKLYCASATCTSHTVLGATITDGTGAFSKTVTIPASSPVGKHEIGAIGQSSGAFADRSFTVTS